MSLKLISIKTAAERLDVHTVTLLRAIHAGKLQAHKLGKEYRLSEEDLEKYVKSLRVRAPQVEQDPEKKAEKEG